MTRAPDAIAPGIRRLLAPNPSAMTERGTNTWLFGAPNGRGPLAVIDPGPQSEPHLAAILKASPDGISHILITHAHLDHTALAPGLSAASGAPVLAFGAARAGRSAAMQAFCDANEENGGEGVDKRFSPDRCLRDEESVCGADWTLRALHTPGHMGNHLTFVSDRGHFTGDLVMGWASSLISPPDGDVAAYRHSCARLLALPDRPLFPGHGPVVAAGHARIAALLGHRQDRETAILAAMARIGPASAEAIARVVYTDTPAALLAAATRNVLAHLIDLSSRGAVTSTAKTTPANQWTLLRDPPSPVPDFRSTPSGRHR